MASSSEGSPQDEQRIIVEGITRDGRKFRPSDWVERFAGNAATFGADNRLHYSPYMKPTVHDGIKGLLVDPELRQHRPKLFEQLIRFVRSNDLRVPHTCGVPELDEHMAEDSSRRSEATV